MTNDELDALCKKRLSLQPPGWGEALRGAIPAMTLEPGKKVYAFDPGREVVKLTTKKRSNWRIDVKILESRLIAEFYKVTPNATGTVVSASIDTKALTLTVYPTPVERDLLEIEYAPKEEGPNTLPTKRPILGVPIPTLGGKKPA